MLIHTDWMFARSEQLSRWSYCSDHFSFIHHCQHPSRQRGKAALARSRTPGDLSEQDSARGENIVAESFHSAVSSLLRCCRVIPAPTCHREQQHVTHSHRQIHLLLYREKPGQTVSPSSVCCCPDSSPIHIEYKQPLCNEPGDDSPALQFVGLQLGLPTASEMCLMCCDA